MSRSRRHTPIISNCLCASEKWDKVHANRRLRVATRQALSSEAEIMPEILDVSDVWVFGKDGRRWFGNSTHPRAKEWLRK